MFGIAAISSFSQIQNHNHNAQKGSGEANAKQKIQCSQHCELTLALHLAERFTAQKVSCPIKIGCSKASCYWCHVYILELNKTLSNNKVITFATHGKRVKGWLLPRGHDKVADIVLQHVGNEVENVFEEAHGLPRKKSDSRSVSSSLVGHSEIEDNESGFGPLA